jgi:hypothetical protein
MGEDVWTLGLFTLRDYNSTEPELKAKDHLFCITYFQNHEEYPVILLWKRGKKIYTRTCNTPGLKMPKDSKTVMELARLQIAAVRILEGEKFNLFDI